MCQVSKGNANENESMMVVIIDSSLGWRDY
jgi:hypothetical protein